MTSPQANMTGLEAAGQDALATTLHSVARFMRTVRLRSGILLACLVVSGIMGAAYYSTAPRIYQSSASLYVVKKDSVTEERVQGASDSARDMPTFRKLMSCEAVMQRALSILPERFKGGFEGLSEAEAVMMIQASLSVSSEFNTKVLDLKYRSRDPKVAAAVLTAVLAAYQGYMTDVSRDSSDQNH